MIPAPPPALVETAIPFRPPEGVPLRYETRTERPGPRGPIVLRSVNEVRFARDGAGWRMTTTLIAHDATGSPAAAALMEVGMRPMRGVPVRLALGRDGAPGGLMRRTVSRRTVGAAEAITRTTTWLNPLG